MNNETNETTVIEEQQPNFNFDVDSWTTAPTEPQQEIKVEAPKQQEPAKTEPSAAPDFNSYIKEKWGYENEESLNEHLQRGKTAKELKFENEQSEKLFNLLREGKEDDVYSFLENKKMVERLANAEVDNVSVASEILRYNLKNKYPELNDSEVERKFQKQFGLPTEPKQDLDETDEEYEERIAEYKERRQEAEMDIMMEAKLAKKDIEGLKTDLKLPEFQQQNGQQEPTQEELQKFEEERDAYEKGLESAYKSFDGFKTTAKSGEAELSIAFVPTEQEKTALKDRLFEFDTNDFLAERWIDDKGIVNSQKAMQDVYLLENRDRIFQKIANDSAAQAIENYIKNRGNVNVDTMGKQTTPQFANDDQNKQLMDAIWSA